MHVPKPFALPEDALSELYDLIEDQVFGILAPLGDGSSEQGRGDDLAIAEAMRGR